MRTVGLCLFAAAIALSLAVGTPTLDFLYEHRVDHAYWDRGFDAMLKFLTFKTESLSQSELRRYRWLRLGNILAFVLLVSGMLLLMLG